MAGAKTTKKQKEALAELDRLAREKGLKVSYGDLRFGGLKLKGGQCLFRGEKWLVLDRKQPYDDQVEVFRDALDDFELQPDEIPDRLRGLLGRRPAKSGARAKGDNSETD
jgi:hypothetical protein